MDLVSLYFFNRHFEFFFLAQISIFAFCESYIYIEICNVIFMFKKVPTSLRHLLVPLSLVYIALLVVEVKVVVVAVAVFVVVIVVVVAVAVVVVDLILLL